MLEVPGAGCLHCLRECLIIQVFWIAVHGCMQKIRGTQYPYFHMYQVTLLCSSPWLPMIPVSIYTELGFFTADTGRKIERKVQVLLIALKMALFYFTVVCDSETCDCPVVTCQNVCCEKSITLPPSFNPSREEHLCECVGTLPNHAAQTKDELSFVHNNLLY